VAFRLPITRGLAFHEQIFLALIQFPFPEAAINRPKSTIFENIFISNSYIFMDM
jgi:hypothetical protein